MSKEFYSCVIIDDHTDSIEQITEYIEQFKKLKIIKAYSNSVDAIDDLNNLPFIDFLFLDIEMPSINGLTFAQKIRDRVNNLVFITAHPKYAIDAFNVSANGFLPKPVSYDKFENLMSTLIQKLGNEAIVNSN